MDFYFSYYPIFDEKLIIYIYSNCQSKILPAITKLLIMLWGYFLQFSYALWLLVFNTTFNKYVSFCQFGCEEIGIHEYNYGTSRKILKPSITKSAVQYTLPRAKINLTTSAAICTDSMVKWKSNYHLLHNIVFIQQWYPFGQLKTGLQN